MKINLPYDVDRISIEIPDENFVCSLVPGKEEGSLRKSQEEIVEEALAHPIGSPSLEELVSGKKRMVIISSDHTRPVPSHITMPILLRHIRDVNPDIDVTILIATGFHRPTTQEELVKKFGEKIASEEKIVVHRAFEDEMADLGTLPSGGRLLLNRVAIDTELLIAEGFIEPHFFAGFSGGRKAVLPGIASGTTVMANHCSEFIASPCARTGILEKNPIHEDMLYAAEQAKLAFILNVAINPEKEIIAAFAGHFVKAHEAGCRFVGKRAEVRKCPTDIVVSTNGGYPLDQNIYQSVKGMTAAEANCNENGVIIMVAGCRDGHGGESLYRQLKEAESPRGLLERFAKVPRNETSPDQWEAQILARILDKFTVILVTDLCDAQMIRDMHMEHAAAFEDALRRAFELKGPNASVSVIPDGVSVIVRA